MDLLWHRCTLGCSTRDATKGYARAIETVRAPGIAYVEETLAKHPEVRCTFVFLGEPAWKNPSEDFLATERLLQYRSYTFIARLLHYYEIEQRFDRDYITMGPTGASFHKDGPGNVDHIL